jgi:two-component system, NtrC family, sensor kinase
VNVPGRGKVAERVLEIPEIAELEASTYRFQASEEVSQRIIEGAAAGIVLLDTAGRFLSMNSAARRLLGFQDGSAAAGALWFDCWSGAVRGKVQAAFDSAAGGKACAVDGTCCTAFASTPRLEVSMSVIRDPRSSESRVVAVVRDVTDRVLLEAQSAQAQKLESIGQLAAGIAHEINTPIQYVGDNARFLQDGFARLKPMLRLEALSTEFREDAEYLGEEIPKAIEQLLEGVEHVARIVRAMKEFSHPGPPDKTPVDLNRALQNTAMVSRNEWKYVADLVEDLDPALPTVQCVPGEINQVILNLIVNAAHAIADRTGGKTGSKGSITLSSRRDGDGVEIRVRDTGTGIPEAARAKVFDPFFTTKEVGKGTGQGLAIAHTVVVKNHGGTIRFETEAGAGTTFIVRLPVTGT